MAYTTINKSSDYFNNKIYTGNGSTQSITGVGFQPDWVWFKNRSSSNNNRLFDVVRGAGKNLVSNTNGAEINAGTGTDGQLRTFDSDGFSVGSDGSVNHNGQNIVAWNWKAGGGQGSSNTDGSINTTYTSVNTTAGFSISKYTGTGSAGATVGHGLGVAPKMIIAKGLTYADVWIVGGDNLGGWNKEMYLNSTSAVATNNNAFNGVAPTSSVFTLGSGNGTNKSGDTYIAYCFAEKQGYSKFGSYAGNGNADGTFVYTGFKPAWIMTKQTNGSDWWVINDTKRDTFNASTLGIRPNDTAAESSDSAWTKDILSNGFKQKTANGGSNGSGNTYIYMAFAEAPLVGTNNIPANAR